MSRPVVILVRGSMTTDQISACRAWASARDREVADVVELPHSGGADVPDVLVAYLRSHGDVDFVTEVPSRITRRAAVLAAVSTRLGDRLHFARPS